MQVLLENGVDLLVGHVAGVGVEHLHGHVGWPLVVLVVELWVLAGDVEADLDDLLDESEAVLLNEDVGVFLGSELEQEDGHFAQVDAVVLVLGDEDGLLDDHGQVGAQHLLDLHELVEHLEHLVDQVLVVEVEGVEHQGDEVVVLLERLDGLGRGRELVDRLDTQGLEAGHVRLQVALDDGVELAVVLLDLVVGEVLDDDGEEDHGELLVGELLGLRAHEDELEELGPLLVGNEDLAQRADHFGDVLLDEGDWLDLEPLEEQVLGGVVLVLGEVGPELAHDFSEVDAGDLPQLLVGVLTHDEQEVLKRLDLLEVLLEGGGGLCDHLGVVLEQVLEELA
mmetsp:Transcript_5505/g.9346  ORF Transcript_5505/g.9346 Transcript_5505/m.9346 type:complete len:338 (-) Transcript_5505:63-1076(-)